MELQMNKKKFFMQGVLLTAISLILRVTNIAYRSFLSQKIGAEGIGLYQLIFSIFMLAVTLSTSGISLAVTRMVTAAIVTEKRGTIRSLVSRCFLFCLCVSLSISLILFTGADFAADVFLGNAQAANCLRILGVGLPFMSLCTCMKGYFLAVDESVSTGISDVLENLLTIFATAALFWYFAPTSIEAACLAAMIASTLGEITSFTFAFISYRRSLRRNTPKEQKKSKGVLHGLTHIALPCTLSSAARSLLNTGENLLIPKELQKSGLSYQISMSQYGLLHGMTMPMLYFPSSLLGSFASLLIPRISREREQNHKKAVAYITGKALSSALVFGIFFAAVFIAFGESWGSIFYHNDGAGEYLRILAPIVPLMYLDVVVDSLLKGMDEQFNSMKYNFFDSLLRVLLVLCLLQFFGMKSYIGILFFSTIFNASLSLSKLLKVTHVTMYTVRQILLPTIAAVLSVFIASILIPLLPAMEGFVLVIAQIVISSAFYLGIMWVVHKFIPQPQLQFREKEKKKSGFGDNRLQNKAQSRIVKK